MTSAHWDTFFKVASIVSSLILVPTFGWVWSTNESVQEMTVEVAYIKKEVASMESHSTDIELIKKDLYYIKEHIGLIKEALAQLERD